MTLKHNLGCASCDNQRACTKKIKTDSGLTLAKEQDVRNMTCLYKVQDKCRTCPLFKKGDCAYWKQEKGEVVSLGSLLFCPKKEKYLANKK